MEDTKGERGVNLIINGHVPTAVVLVLPFGTLARFLRPGRWQQQRTTALSHTNSVPRGKKPAATKHQHGPSLRISITYCNPNDSILGIISVPLSIPILTSIVLIASTKVLTSMPIFNSDIKIDFNKYYNHDRHQYQDQPQDERHAPWLPAAHFAVGAWPVPR